MVNFTDLIQRRKVEAQLQYAPTSMHSARGHSWVSTMLGINNAEQQADPFRDKNM